MNLGPLKKSNECPICNGVMETLFSFPKMPVAGFYEPCTEPFNDRGYVDQAFLFCQGCSHGKLETIVPPTILYGEGYRTVSAKSAGAMRAIANFVSFINYRIPLSCYDCVVDIGGNDGSLLTHFKHRLRVLIDPNAGGDHELVKSFIEDADLDFLKGVKKLICCSHTLEHIEKPDAMFAKLRAVVNHGDYCAFQFPSLDYLVKDCRIDQIYHEHIHYYSLRSTSLLLAKYGFEIVSHEFDPSHYGTLMIVFRRGLQEQMGEPVKAIRISRAYANFSEQTRTLNDRLSSFGPLIGYGASLMLPLLVRYLPALRRLEYVMDEDESKHGLRYTNLNVQIKPTHDLEGRDVMVTAFNTKMAVREIVKKLFAMQAGTVIVPFNLL